MKSEERECCDVQPSHGLAAARGLRLSWVPGVKFKLYFEYLSIVNAKEFGSMRKILCIRHYFPTTFEEQTTGSGVWRGAHSLNVWG